MRKIDDETRQRILDATDIVEVVSDFVSLKRRGANYIGLCPFHNERTPSFSVSRSRGICKCFSCGEGGSAVNFIMKIENIGYYDALKYLARKYGIEVKADAVTYTSFVAMLLKEGKLKAHNTGKTVVFQDPYQLSRDLEETEEPREIIKAYATLHEMLLNRRETVWAGNILMAEYLPEVIKEVAARRLYNVESIHETAVVTASVSEYAALKSVNQDKITVLSIEDLILGE